MLKATKSFRFIVVGLFTVMFVLSALPFAANAQRIAASSDAGKIMRVDRADIDSEEARVKAANFDALGQGPVSYQPKLGDIPAREVVMSPAVAGTCNDVLPALSNIEVEATNSANNAGYATLQLAHCGSLRGQTLHRIKLLNNGALRSGHLTVSAGCILAKLH